MTKPTKNIDLKSLIYKTSISVRDADKDIFDDFNDELGFDAESVTDIGVESKKAAKIWMAAIKFVTPAIVGSHGLTKDNEKANKVANAILEQSTSGAFSNIVDAYSCGAAFNEANIFGLYRYALSNSANCTSLLALTHGKIIADFSRVVTAHLCEVVSGVVPISNRAMPEGDINSTLSTQDLRNLLQIYLQAEYPKTDISPKVSLQVSLINALSKTTSIYMVRCRAKPVFSVISDILESTIVDSAENWIESTKRATNGNILVGVDDTTKAMIVQNALNLVSAISNAAIEKVSNGDLNFMYQKNIADTIASVSNELLAAAVQKTNSYASAFAKNEKRIFDAVQDAALPFTRKVSEQVSPNAWLALFELPTKISRFLTHDIAASEKVSSVNLSSIADHILKTGIFSAVQVRNSIDVHDDWALRILANEALDHTGTMLIRDLDSSTIDAKAISTSVRETVDKAIEKGFESLFQNASTAEISSVKMLKVSLAANAIKFDSLFSGLENNVDRYKAISILQQIIVEKAIELKTLLQIPGINADSQTMQFGCCFNAAALATYDNVRHEIFNNLSSSSVSIIKDIVNGSDALIRIKGSVADLITLMADIADHGYPRLNSIVNRGVAPKKLEAAEEMDETTKPAALAL